jgi:predicted SprT family Zn-dependent metalloprotease
MSKATEIYPVQCDCGHIFLEKYKFQEVTDEGNIGFCWCGWCRKKTMVQAEKGGKGNG